MNYHISYDNYKYSHHPKFSIIYYKFSGKYGFPNALYIVFPFDVFGITKTAFEKYVPN